MRAKRILPASDQDNTRKRTLTPAQKRAQEERARDKRRQQKVLAADTAAYHAKLAKRLEVGSDILRSERHAIQARQEEKLLAEAIALIDEARLKTTEALTVGGFDLAWGPEDGLTRSALDGLQQLWTVADKLTNASYEAKESAEFYEERAVSLRTQGRPA